MGKLRYKKTYHRRVFGGKDAEWNGITQGKGELYPNSLHMSLNAVYDDNIFKTRDGQELDETDIFSGAILSGADSGTFVSISAGTEVFAWDKEWETILVAVYLYDNVPNKLYDSDNNALLAWK